MTTVQPAQFKLDGEGRILFQPLPNNPLPGDPVAVLRKGTGPLSPVVEVTPSAHSLEKEAIETWLKTHIAEVLEPLLGLVHDIEKLALPVQGICARLFAAMGITPRDNLEELIAALDPEMRQVLRARRVRLGPVLVFMPALNKPAGVRLRALLWSLWNDKPLPAPVPNDGMVSLKVDPAQADPIFYRAIGYPVYGPRAIRIDMLDRVISAVYDGAKEGKFRAEHKMAEWLGCGIEDLYAVLTALGHTKIEEEAAAPAEPAEKQVEGAKPELAQFRLKKGKASDQPKEKKPFKKEKRADKPEKKKEKPRKDSKKKEYTAHVIQIGPKSTPEDSPFAILQQLKVKKDG
ncbi:MAG: hypothetical protein IT558_03980 [Alphaproteobacteria bacterium]|nr:hypothetical protein [Alphaproteobacteria bacterium]